MRSFPIKLNPELPTPLYRQLAEAFQNAVATGQINPGEVVPTTRKLSEQLGISRQTVISAYDLLVSQNVLQVNSNGTTVVLERKAPLIKPVSTVVPAQLSNRISGFAQKAIQLDLYSQLEDFTASAPPTEQFPASQWRRQLAKHAQKNEELLQPAQDAFGLLKLRNAIAEFLGRAHGIACSGSQIMIYSGGHPALEFVVKLFINPGDKVIIEDPGNSGARRIFLSYDADLIPLPVDSDGLIVEKLDEIGEKVKMIFIHPSHQQPTGAVLSPSRREILLDWATKHDVIIVENHYDSEFRYTSRPMPALFGTDSQRVIYLSTFWKVLGPIVRIGFVVLPEELLAAAGSLRQISERSALSLLEQHALADFIEAGDLERTIKRNKSVYMERRNALIAGLSGKIAKHADFSKEAAGLHQYVRFDDQKTHTQIKELGARAALPLIPIDYCYLSPKQTNEFVIPFAQLTKEEMTESIEKFTELFFNG